MPKRIGPLRLIRCQQRGHDWYYIDTDYPDTRERYVRHCPRCDSYQDFNPSARTWDHRPRYLSNRQRLGGLRRPPIVCA